MIHLKKLQRKLFIFPFLLFNFSLLVLMPASCNAQPGKQKLFTHQDTLRGTNTIERAWWDVNKYYILVQPDYNTKTIEGTVTMYVNKVPGQNKTTIMQLDLQEPMILDTAYFFMPPEDDPKDTLHPKKYGIPFTREGNVYHLETKEFNDKINKLYPFVFVYHGKPREAVHPPWDGGWIWKKDAEGRPWMSVACQGLGASVWYPCKDYQGDEPDHGAKLTITVSDTLTAVGNGRLVQKRSHGDGFTSWTWLVTNPINNYNIIPYIGKYVTWHEDFHGEKGKLDCDYWVLDYNLEKSKQEFKDVPKMLKCFEHWFGPYPFYEDSYKLVDAPHLGMEHQSAVAYGNEYKKGYLGTDLSGTGWGNKWDFIIVHESGHEWFANNITTNDIADMWIHEGFTNYSETLFTTCEFGVEAGNDYCIGSRKRTQNDKPIIGPYGVNEEGSSDMYYKGGNLLHTIRQIINDDEKFRQILRGLNKDFYHKTVDSKDVEAYISKQAGIDFSKVFDQYLRTTQIPVLEYKADKNSISYRWTNCIKDFKMAVKVNVGGHDIWLQTRTDWQQELFKNEFDPNTFKADRNFYIQVKKTPA